MRKSSKKGDFQLLRFIPSGFSIIESLVGGFNPSEKY